MRRRFSYLAVLLATLVPAASAQAVEKVVIAMAASTNEIVSLMAQQKGYFKDRGLDVEIKLVPRGSVAIEGASGGSAQFAESAHAPFISAVSKGLPLIAVAVATRGFYGKMVAAPKWGNLKTLADFKGKRIGIQVGTGVHAVILMLLQKEGLKPDDFKFTNLRVVDMPAAMATSDNSFDAVIGWEPGMHRIVASGHGKLIIDAPEFEKMAHITYPFLLSTTEQYRKLHPDVVQKVVDAYAMADKYILAHKDEATAVFLNAVKKRGGKLSAEESRLMLFDTNRFGGPAFTSTDVDDIEATRDFLVKTGKAKSIPFDKIIDRSYGKKAQAAQ